jgi:hypothetical protein
VGAAITAVVGAVLLFSKFTQGAWLVVLAIPSLVTLYLRIRTHYDAVARRLRMASDLVAVHVDLGGGRTERFLEQWQRQVPEVKLVVLESPFRSLVSPVVDYVKQFEQQHRKNRNHFCVIVLPVFVTRRRWENLLHNQSMILLRNALRAQGTRVVTTVGFYL